MLLKNPLEQFDIIMWISIYKLFSWSTFTWYLLINLVIVCFVIAIHLPVSFNFLRESQYINRKFLWFIYEFKPDLSPHIVYALPIKSTLVFFFNSLWNLVKRTLKDNVSLKKNSFLFIFYFLFLIILISNLVGMIPFSTTITSHFIFTLFYSLSFFIGINIIGILYQKEKYFGLFLPDGVPTPVIPLLILIEYISYFSRILSLSVRLFANMMSGHILMKILIGFVWSMLSLGPYFLTNSCWIPLTTPFSILSFLPFIIVFCIIGLEFVIAFLQAYVFLTLLSIYLNDVINLH